MRGIEDLGKFGRHGDGDCRRVVVIEFSVSRDFKFRTNAASERVSGRGYISATHNNEDSGRMKSNKKPAPIIP